ncbi:hypothetical protein F4V43_00865 [Paenibacillus spiritus]|uniref:TM2 domain-containing protein n=1 Tax=Paenibacillus spiritus TaxID=2496557 RepID=A0A5J5GJX8_9BACL|nr:hypothetical protein [Paenibacillus spiritus]KAA9008465.1 hypothetical protein F4V43_00865 [Paenibacillus spiritus]
MLLKKRRWLTFMLAMVPGVGHLYLGFKKLGMQFMVGAFLCIIFIPSMPSVFSFALAALWFYQLFDALQKATWNKLMFKERERTMFYQQQDPFYQPDPYAGPWGLNPPGMPDYPQDPISPVWVGGGCILAGTMLLIITVFPGLWEFLTDINIGTILLASGLIGYGFYMLRKNARF